MLLFPPPHEYRLIHTSLFPQVRLAVCCLLSKSLKNLKKLSSPWSLTATSHSSHQSWDTSSCRIWVASSCPQLILTPEMKLWRNQSLAPICFSGSVGFLYHDAAKHSWLVTLFGCLLLILCSRSAPWLSPVLLGDLGEEHAELAVSFIAAWNRSTSLQQLPAEPAFPGCIPSLVPADSAQHSSWWLLSHRDIDLPPACRRGDLILRV